jgi:hypothetical protein
MTSEQFDRLIPGKSILKTEINGVEKEVLFKFFLCNTENFDGYWLCVTENMKNPESHKMLDTDWQVYYNLCKVVKFE